MRRFPIDREDYILFLIVIPIIILAGILYFIIKPNDRNLEVMPTVSVKDNVVDNYLIINEVSIYPKEAVELKNNGDDDIDLFGYSLSDKSGEVYKLDGVIKKKGFLVFDKLPFSINNSNEIIYLSYEGKIIDKFEVNKLIGDISTGISNGDKVYYKKITLGSENTDKFYKGYSDIPIFSINGGYIKKNEKVELDISDDSKIYYTTDGTFPTLKSKLYTEPIVINKDMVIKAFSVKEGYLESDIVSRTFIVSRTHDIAFISISTNNFNFYREYHSTREQKASFEFYESDGSFGTSFLSDIKVSGKSSSLLPQKSISIYLRKKYGTNSVTYPFFDDVDYNTYSSLMIRNGGTDPTKIHIKDAVLTRILKGEMDIDSMEYRPVAVYLNGNYYGLYSLREKLNGDYIESKYNISKDNIDIIKKWEAERGDKKEYQAIINYIKKNDVKNKEVYDYIKSKIDIQEMINYWIVESYYNNSDFFKRNIGLWKSEDGKWRFMLYDLDYAFEDYETRPTLFLNTNPYYNNDMQIIVKLYQNEEFKDTYLTSLGKYLESTFKVERVNKIIDDMTKEVEKEMSYHVKRWAYGYNYPYGWDYIGSVSSWKNNINTLKARLKNRYREVVNNLKRFKLSSEDYKKYFGGLT